LPPSTEDESPQPFASLYFANTRSPCLSSNQDGRPHIKTLACLFSGT
jgi:hypothetical protein